MKEKLSDEFNVRAHLDLCWLRPESALWDAIAAKQLAPHLVGKRNILELGIGNGYFSFLLLGGRFKPEFDWYYNVATEFFWENADIYDFDSGVSMEQYIEKKPDTRIQVALDHKQSLLNQAVRLGFVDTLIQHDCNESLPRGQFKTVYSNILYWLNDPFRTIDDIASVLTSGGELIIAFPNADFYRTCRSYNTKDGLWELINRGRGNHIMWHMDIPDFEREIVQRGFFDVVCTQRYLSPTTLKIWDIGLRPLSVMLIKMANALSPEKRLEIKQEWCDTLLKFAEPLLAEEMEQGSIHGGFNLVKLVRK
jgi:SAM-dependent methyltransferase